MIGSVVGDIIGSVYEMNDLKGRDLAFFTEDSTFTDDSILSCAIAKSCLEDFNYKKYIVEFAKNNCNQDSNGPYTVGPGFGSHFIIWVLDSEDHEPYGSYGNGSIMRTGPIGWAFNEIEDVLKHAEIQSSVSHNHPDAIESAKMVSICILLARKGWKKEDIINYINDNFFINVDHNLDYLHENYSFDSTAIGSVGEALSCVFQANNFVETMKNVLYIGGDTDTIGSVAGSVAEAMYGVPYELATFADDLLMRYNKPLHDVIVEFESKYGCNRIKKQVLKNNINKMIRVFSKNHY